MGILDILKGGGQKGVKPGPAIEKETRTYEEIMDEITTWNIANTDILNVLRKEVNEERLLKWSRALETGVRKGLIPDSGKVEDSLYYPVYLDLYQFIKSLRLKLLMDPTMKNVKEIGRLDSCSVCIICGIRALQKDIGAKRLINTLQWKVMERYLG